MAPRHPADQPEWRAFEAAVAAFLSALEPGAKVTHDTRTPDVDTGISRQRDVWIEMPLLGGLVTLKILVSCKRKKSKLSQQDIDAFIGELQGAGANLGVLYSHAGFTGPALSKARSRGIECCCLYQDRAAELPGVLTFNAYCLREQLKLDVSGVPSQHIAALLSSPLSGDDSTILDRLITDYDIQQRTVMADPARGLWPSWHAEIVFDGERPIKARLSSGWSVYRARPEACLLNGTYSWTGGAFLGSRSTPWVDQHNTHPGPGWELVEQSDLDRTKPNLVIYSWGGDIRESMSAHIARTWPNGD